jgi:excinuclease ABC subunit C
MLIDGGRGQLAAAMRAAETCGATDITFASLAKREEEVYLPGRSEPMRLPRNHRALRLLQRMRDEAHRFAHRFNRSRRQKKALSSELTEIPGIGPVRRKALLGRFGSVRALRGASPDEIAAVPGFSRRLAEQVTEHLSRGS